ncbi:tryptophan--tRNA ligase [Candidatus Kaiserbacteria bacterium CG10_big_fil_rev_8_21_14_0_10_43_70]|uniref:Tryptophan--tRNA ligase n=1 Tax=Candidatus Kaiserbacteria bacterium CG10_big_fil_rev_8_21_14_0_10_43_70 TaxID=1974605 RepID=A0A2H0UJ56_9BACT|nr:MAG: tryptophan--tRNA ligase [Candidatus Kaiserbacteria bacterium CG10_big_fil_rev_8_21_14_0_10_43_70]
MSTKKRLLSGVKPTGRLHLGNYFGAMKQFVDFRDEYQNFVFVADYHALTSWHSQKNPEEIRESIKDIVRGYLAIGLDPQKTTFFQQSKIFEHTELAWIFDCITTMPYLMRAHAFKDAEAKNKEISVGTFTYPMLMASDILLYDADVVPVGKDQQQHVEYARDTAEKFNNLYGETFKLPEHMIPEDIATVPGTDGQKMSKSYNNTIPLFGSRNEIEETVMSIVTDSSGEKPKNVYAIHRLLKSEGELETLYKENEGKYKAIKEALIEDLDAMIAPFREMRAQITDEDVRKVLEEGNKKAKAVASAKMKIVREKIGVTV